MVELGTLQQLLVHDHHGIDKPIAAWIEGHGELDALADAVRELRRHIYMEEEVLFPPLAQAGNQMPVMVMIREHAWMWPVLDQIDAELGGAQDTATLQGLCTELAEQLRNHNEKEEEILYTQADKILNSGQAGLVESLLDTHVMPRGWTAQGLA